MTQNIINSCCSHIHRTIWKVRRKLAVWLVEHIYRADMMWDYDDPEDGGVDSIMEWASEKWMDAAPGVIIDKTFSRAMGLPNQTYQIECYEDANEDTQFRIKRIPNPVTP